MKIREMEVADIPLGLALCRLAGWNQLEADWRRFFDLSPGGVFVSEEDGRACGTASTMAYGTRLAWIGMVLVHPDFRRRGIGSALMRHGLDHLAALGVECVKLDATDQGRPVYLKLGFQDERPIWRTLAPAPKPPALPGARPLESADWPAIARLDAPAFDADRLDLLRRLAQDGPAVVVGAGDDLRAYGFSRLGHDASYLGPLVATDAEAAAAAASALLAALPSGPAYWDLLPDNAPARDLASSLGFSPVRELTRMYRGAPRPGKVARLYAGAGFEAG